MENKPMGVKHIIYHKPYTTVYWEDGTSTTVKAEKHDPYDLYHGFLAALAKKVYGSNSAVSKMIVRTACANLWTKRHEAD